MSIADPCIMHVSSLFWGSANGEQVQGLQVEWA
jgi:hypothetical protein